VVPVGARRVALNVNRVTVFEPFAGGVTGLGRAVADTPLGNSICAPTRPAELNPPSLVMVSVVDALPPSSMVKEAGESFRVKFFVVVVLVTVKDTVVVSTMLPDVPVTFDAIGTGRPW